MGLLYSCLGRHSPAGSREPGAALKGCQACTGSKGHVLGRGVVSGNTWAREAGLQFP